MKKINIKIPPKSDLYKAFLLFQSFFLIILVFATMRPLQSSLVMQKLGSKFFPYIWVISAVVIGVVVLIFNKLSDYFSRTGLFSISILSSAFVFLGLRFLLASETPWIAKTSAAVLAIWSDVFVVVMIEQFWAFANDFFKTSHAKKLYGLMDTGSVLGGVIGSLSVSVLVSKVGAFNILYFCIGYLFLLFIPVFLVKRLLKNEPSNSANTTFKTHGALSGIKYFSNNRYLRLILLAVLISQVVTNLVEYHFNLSVEAMRQNLDAQTSYLGNIHFYINFGSFLSNAFLVGPCLVLLGVRPTMLVLPLVNGAFSFLQVFGGKVTNMASSLWLFNLSLFARVADKSLGYTFFRSSKEILYIPLDTETKFKAKTVIDMFVYRFGKLLGSLLIIPAVQILGLPVLQPMIFALVLIHIGVILTLTRLYLKKSK